MMDDTGVPVIGGMSFADGWRTEAIRVRGRGEEVFIAPDGLRYVRASESERADLIYHRVSKRFTMVLHARLRLEEGSSLVKKMRRERRLVTQGDSLDNLRRKARKIRRKR